MTNIFVAKLDYGVTQEHLKAEFEKFGKVSKVSVAMDKETGKSKGFAFIEMFNEDEAKQAIEALDGITLSGRQIAVKQAEDRSNSRGSDSRPSRDSSVERKPFEKRPAPVTRDFSISDDDDKPVFVLPENDKFKGLAKKDVPKKKENSGKNLSDGKPKQQKMEAYKKSGKNNRFFNVDDDDDY
ncbi:MAG: hypothetical protein V4622_10655 [Bacteroidota bacterium]